jgi:hypothetical protein
VVIAVAAVAAVAAAGSAATAATAAGDVAAERSGDFAPIANDVGRAWVVELVGVLEADERAIVGAWPGTISEARIRVLARVGRTIDLGILDELARLAQLVAKQRWQQITQPDPEP